MRSRPRSKPLKDSVTARSHRTRERPDRERTFIEKARRRQILDVALELFSKHGYNQTSLSDISAAVGVSKGVISYHFHGKAELGIEALRHMLRLYGDFVRGRLKVHATARDKLLELPGACIDFVQQNPSVYLVYLDTLGSFGTAMERQRFMSHADAGMRGLICELLREAQAQKHIPQFPVQPVADVLQAAVDGLTEQSSVAPGSIDLEASKRVVQTILAAILDGHVSLGRR